MPAHTHERAPARVSKTARRLFQQMKKTKDKLALLVKKRAPTGIEPHPPATRRATRRRLTGHHPCRTGYRQIKSETGFFRKFPSLAEPMRASLRCNATRCYR